MDQRTGTKRACDFCRRRKIRCEGGGEATGKKCENCTAQGFNCTYDIPQKKRVYDSRQVRRLRDRYQELENRVSQMQRQMKRIGAVDPSMDFTTARPRSLVPQASTSSLDKQALQTPQSGDSQSIMPKDNADADSSDDEYGQVRLLTEHVEELSLATDAERRYHGKSSMAHVINNAAHGIPSLSEVLRNNPNQVPAESRRNIFWTTACVGFGFKPSEYGTEYNFPEPSSLHELAEIYFARVEPFIGLLHRSSFFRSLDQGLHRTNRGFGGVVLLVCALGALHSDNPRHRDNYTEGGNNMEPESQWNPVGWKWASQVDPMRNALSHMPSLYDLQMYALLVVTVHAYPSVIDLCTLAAIGVRRAQGVGAHRRNAYGPKPTIEGELWKRAFWALVSADRWLCAAFGRPCSIQEEDIDVDLPVEVDDEFWDHPDPAHRFVQPEGKLCIRSFNIYVTKLREILSDALRTIYSTKKSRFFSGLVGADWEQRVVAELDSSMNRWQEMLPSHLKWDPDRADNLFFEQSACLACTFFHTQIFIHRRFISILNAKSPSPLADASIVICLNAARSCARIAQRFSERARGRPQTFAFFHLFKPPFDSVIILLINISRAIQKGEELTEQHVKDLEMARKCMDFWQPYENRFQSAGKLRDVLLSIAWSCGLSIPSPSSSGSTDSFEPTPPQEPDMTAVPAVATGNDFSPNDMTEDEFTRWMGFEAMRAGFGNPLGDDDVPTDPLDLPFLPFDLSGSTGPSTTSDSFFTLDSNNMLVPGDNLGTNLMPDILPPFQWGTGASDQSRSW